MDDINEQFEEASQPIMIDKLNDPIEQVWEHELEWINNRIQLLKDEGRLCMGTGEEVIAEFGLTGDYDNVLQELIFLFSSVKANPYTEADRFDVIVRHNRFVEHKNEIEDIYEQRIKESFNARKSQGVQSIIDAANTLDQKKNYLSMLHDKKECACYFN